MLKRTLIVVVVLTALGGGAWMVMQPGPPKPAPQGDALDAALEGGEVIVETEPVEGTETPQLHVRAVIEAAPEKVWAIIEDCSRYKETMVRVEAAEELSREGNVVTCRTTVDMPFPLSDITATTRAVHTVEPGKQWRREWDLIEGDYARNTGSWVLTPYQGNAARTFVDYRILVEPNTSIPDSVRIAAQQKAMPDLIEKLREQVR